MIDIRKLKELVRLMVANDLTELDLRDPEEQVLLRRGSSAPMTPMMHAAPVVAAAPVASAAAVAGVAAGDQPAEAAPADDTLTRIDSPMVGTFYDKPNPDAEPFVTVGTRVSDDTVVCMVEAMKIFNEIKAECTGTVHRILPGSGEPVEFGQPLFEIRKD